MIYIQDPKGELSEKQLAWIEGVIETTIKGCHFPYPYEVSLIVVQDHEIKEINKEHRDKDEVTDVLSFPMIGFHNPEDYEEAKDDIAFNENPENDDISIGDIIISLEQVRRQSKEIGHSFEREFAFLVVHSILHLFGHDHMNEDEEKKMVQRQKELMSQLDLTLEN